jgi:hypothetical protein
VIIRGGHTIEVWRSTGRDRFGDATETLVGTIEHVVFQWTSANPMDRAQETDMMSTVIFCPRNAAIQLRARDRIKFRGETYAVIGDPSWNEDNPATGYNFGYYMMQVQVMG